MNVYICIVLYIYIYEYHIAVSIETLAPFEIVYVRGSIKFLTSKTVLCQMMHRSLTKHHSCARACTCMRMRVRVRKICACILVRTTYVCFY